MSDISRSLFCVCVLLSDVCAVRITHKQTHTHTHTHTLSLSVYVYDNHSEYSTQLNNQRLELLQRRDELLLEVYEAAQESLRQITGGTGSGGVSYESLLCELIVQGCRRLEGETKVSVACRPQDHALCTKAAQAATMKIGAVPSISVIEQGSKAYGLPSESCGGVVIYSGDMRTVCKNTLDERLRICFEQSTPKVCEITINSLLCPSCAVRNVTSVSSKRDRERLTRDALVIVYVYVPPIDPREAHGCWHLRGEQESGRERGTPAFIGWQHHISDEDTYYYYYVILIFLSLCPISRSCMFSCVKEYAQI